MTKEEVLKKYFGYDHFRVGQDTLVNGILSGHDALGIMPTGVGEAKYKKYGKQFLEALAQ